MRFRLPFLALIVSKNPMEGLTKHYNKIAECIQIINDSVECYVTGDSTCKDFGDLIAQIDKVESEADKIKRSIRNHLPHSMFMSVDKTLFFNYTRSQDNILDYAQEALHWLGMRKVSIPEIYQKDLIILLSEVNDTTMRLGPALKATIELNDGTSLDRANTKRKIRKVRRHYAKAVELRKALTDKIYKSDMDFKDIYQLMHFVDCLSEMAHEAEGCADILRAMLAR
ncbi:DUF47 domain-containing protein [Maridesulfovibrio ferrireducens]|uniref:Phosphate transport regulator n=1 Tax=Maridesulfovibrio ferrireducens TaxID=246191 RepID=A0A1G9BTW8_9BACT|nr:DUF47 family protein [Maridesulfovibrio ferrireducens]MBI9111972.1 DUF47 family protein [Maridesulfovibrio ferrireducens]SDK42902.1 hypothetical protein SAMN05660337_0420 [Maridesulfovibrio ferrireducens]